MKKSLLKILSPLSPRWKSLVLGLFFIGSYASAESVYTYDVTRDSIMGSLSLGVFVTPFFIPSDPPPPGTTALDPALVNSFDRGIMFAHKKNLDLLSSIGTYGFLIAPVLPVLGDLGDIDTVLTYGIMYAETFLFTYGTKDILKTAIDRNRPYRYFGPVPSGRETDYLNSFPSGHTALAFMSAAFLSSTFSAEFPDSPWKIPVISAAYSLALILGVTRISSGNHFVTDVMAGAAIGSLYGYLIPALHLRKQKAEGGITLMPVLGGLVVSLKK
jgi:membrane-associated phospholipid phosphatase